MTCRAGITTRLEERKEEWMRKYPNMENWIEVGPFENREAAQKWEDDQVFCEKHPGGDEPDNPNAEWHGYRFEFSG